MLVAASRTSAAHGLDYDNLQANGYPTGFILTNVTQGRIQELDLTFPAGDGLLGTTGLPLPGVSAERAAVRPPTGPSWNRWTPGSNWAYDNSTHHAD